MQDLNIIIKNICDHFNVSPNSIAKKKFGKLPEYTYEDILIRILQNNSGSISTSFTEMSRGTLIRVLQSSFPGKVADKQLWPTYILSSISSKKCTRCLYIKSTSEFYTSDRDGFSSMCKDCESNKHKEHYVENKEAINIRNKTYNLNNKEQAAETSNKYYQTHQAESKARNIKYKLNKYLATPKWADMVKMNIIYANREEGEHVDHIIPLQGDIVCGLHWEHNLQYLTSEQNISKGNKFNQSTYIHEIP